VAVVVDIAHQSVIQIISLHGSRNFDFINTLNAWLNTHGMRYSNNSSSSCGSSSSDYYNY